MILDDIANLAVGCVFLVLASPNRLPPLGRSQLDPQARNLARGSEGAAGLAVSGYLLQLAANDAGGVGNLVQFFIAAAKPVGWHAWLSAGLVGALAISSVLRFASGLRARVAFDLIRVSWAAGGVAAAMAAWHFDLFLPPTWPLIGLMAEPINLGLSCFYLFLAVQSGVSIAMVLRLPARIAEALVHDHINASGFSWRVSPKPPFWQFWKGC